MPLDAESSPGLGFSKVPNIVEQTAVSLWHSKFLTQRIHEHNKKVVLSPYVWGYLLCSYCNWNMVQTTITFHLHCSNSLLPILGLPLQPRIYIPYRYLSGSFKSPVRLHWSTSQISFLVYLNQIKKPKSPQDPTLHGLPYLISCHSPSCPFCSDYRFPCCSLNRCTPASGTLHFLFPLPKILFFWISNTAYFFTSLKLLPKFHHILEAFLYHPLWYRTPFPLYSALFLALTSIWHTMYWLVY